MANVIHQKSNGFVALYLTILVLGIFAAVGVSSGLYIFTLQKAINNNTLSADAYYSAESGIEDALLRLKKDQIWSSPYSFNLDNSSVQVTISDLFAGARTITATGNFNSRIRRVRAVYELSASKAQFFYGAQIGVGGLRMKNNSTVNGNIFSNGSVSGTTGARITGTIKVSGATNSISSVSISGDAYTQSCSQSNIAGTLYAINKEHCTYGVFVAQSPPNQVGLPISQQNVDEWKAVAENGGSIGSQSFSSGTRILGPVKILGDLTVRNTAKLILTGTIWVTGNITISNSAQVILDPSYGSLSGMIISDGLIFLTNSSRSSGSASAGSYLMYLSTSSSDYAIDISNSAAADILYTNNGWIEVENSAQLRQITGYGVDLGNTATVNYEIGLEDVSFTSGPSAGWEITDWKETP